MCSTSMDLDDGMPDFQQNRKRGLGTLSAT